MALLANISVPWVLPILLGAAAVFLLLPRPQLFPRAFGVVAGLAAMILTGWTMLGEATDGVWIDAVLFYSFSALAIVGGVGLVTLRNPARGAVAFALVVLSTCGLFLLQAAPFLMAGTIVIYAGAIVVTFLFVIMLSQSHGPSDADQRSREPALACVAGGCLLAILLFAIRTQYDPTGIDAVITTVNDSIQADRWNVELVRDRVTSLESGSAIAAIANRELEDLEGRLAEAKSDPAKTRAAWTLLRDHLAIARTRIGDLRPSEAVSLSAFGGPPSNHSIVARLPAANVAALGRVLFSDYLLAVELGGTLLLVATIGAIAITHRAAPKRAM